MDGPAAAVLQAKQQIVTRSGTYAGAITDETNVLRCELVPSGLMHVEASFTAELDQTPWIAGTWTQEFAQVPRPQ